MSSSDQEFERLLAEALDPGEIELDPGVRHDLRRQLGGGVRAENLTAWAMDELPDEPRRFLEQRMVTDAPFREEAHSIRLFCGRLETLLPPVPRPGWFGRRRLRRLFGGAMPSRRPLWLGAAAAVALLVALPWTRDAEPQPGIAVESAAGPKVAPGGAGAVPTAIVRGKGRLVSEFGIGKVLPASPEPEFAFGAPPLPPAMPGSVDPGHDESSGAADLPREPVLVLGAGHAKPAAGMDAGRFDFPRTGSVFPDRLLADSGHRFRIGSEGIGQNIPAAGAPPPVPDPGSLALASAQPYLLPALLSGPLSGRPEMADGRGDRWLSAEFRMLELGLPAGAGMDADSWSVAAEMMWQLSPAWRGGISVAGVESRVDVPGFGSVDADGVALAWSLEWRHEGYHAALTHEIGSFDQDLLRRAPGMIYPVGQDATVQHLSLWLTREFGAGGWSHGPVAGLDGAWGSLDGYQEPFAGGVAVAGRDFRSLAALVGWQARGSFDSPVGRWLPHAVAGWRHRPVVPDAAIFQGTAAGSFAVAPAIPERDSFLLEGGLRWLPGDGKVFLDLISSGEWRGDGDSDRSLLFKLGLSF